MHSEDRCTSQNLEETCKGERGRGGRPQLQAKKGSGKDPNDEQWGTRCRFYLWWWRHLPGQKHYETVW